MAGSTGAYRFKGELRITNFTKRNHIEILTNE